MVVTRIEIRSGKERTVPTSASNTVNTLRDASAELNAEANKVLEQGMRSDAVARNSKSVAGLKPGPMTRQFRLVSEVDSIEDRNNNTMNRSRINRTKNSRDDASHHFIPLKHLRVDRRLGQFVRYAAELAPA